MRARICARAARRESSTMFGKYVFLSFMAHIGARAKKNLYLNLVHQNEQKKALAFFHIFNCRYIHIPYQKRPN